jgi:hypothetical protein
MTWQVGIVATLCGCAIVLAGIASLLAVLIGGEIGDVFSCAVK